MRKLQRFCLLAMAVLLLFTAEPASAAKEPEVKASQNTAAKKKKANKGEIPQYYVEAKNIIMGPMENWQRVSRS